MECEEGLMTVITQFLEKQVSFQQKLLGGANGIVEASKHGVSKDVMQATLQTVELKVAQESVALG